MVTGRAWSPPAESHAAQWLCGHSPLDVVRTRLHSCPALVLILHCCFTQVNTTVGDHLIQAQTCLFVPGFTPLLVTKLHHIVHQDSIGQMCVWSDGDIMLGKVHHPDRGKTPLNIRKDFSDQQVLGEF